MTGHTLAARAAAALVAAVAGAASFEHIASVAIGAGERPWVGYALPLAIDGLILVGVAALLEDRRTGKVPRVSARVAVLVGVVATLAANVASAEPTWTARLVAVAAPVSFLLSVEVLTRTGRERPQAATQRPRRPAPAPGAGNGARRRSDAREAVRQALAVQPAASTAELARRAGVSTTTVRRVRQGVDAAPSDVGVSPQVTGGAL